MIQPLRLDFDKLTVVPASLGALVLRHCHLDADTAGADEKLLNMYMLAAIQWFEGETKRAVVSRSHRWVLRGFPCDGFQEIPLPRGKTQSVASIQYVENQQSLTITGPSSSPVGSDFQEDLYSDDGGVLMPSQGDSWPVADLDTPSPVIINFEAGWTVSEIPEDVLQTLLFYVSDAVELRGTSDLDIAGQNLDIRKTFVDKYVLRRVY